MLGQTDGFIFFFIQQGEKGDPGTGLDANSGIKVGKVKLARECSGRLSVHCRFCIRKKASSFPELSF